MNFNEDGLLPPGDYALTIAQLRNSLLVVGPQDGRPWDAAWRRQLVDKLETMVNQLWQVGITEIFIDGSFVEAKAHPNDIDGYFECDLKQFASGDLELALNALDPHKIWTWDSSSRRSHKGYTKKQLPMWHKYRVELYPHAQGIFSGIVDEYGHNQQFPAAFRKTRDTFLPKGIVKIIK